MNDLQSVTKSLSEKEKIGAIIWLVIGILQCFSFVFILSGAWNIYAAITRFKRSNAVLTPWNGIVNTYENELTGIIISIVINVIFGGVIGVAGGIYDLLVVRDYVLKNKKVFEEAGL